MKRWTIIWVVLLIPCMVTAQPKRICVMGSSSAYGYFPNTSIPRDSSWAFKVSKHYKDLGIIDTLYNIGTPGIDCYIGMPTGYTPPPGRFAPNPQFNITRAVNFNPPPDVIIINFPSNNYTVLSEAEIIFCLQTMKDYANSMNILCYITTTQPRDDFVQPAERQKLKDLKALIEATFGVFAIDFWTDIVQDPPIIIHPDYALGDGVHLNPAGHTLLKNRVIEKDIFFGPVPLWVNSITATNQGSHVLVQWQVPSSYTNGVYRLQRQNEGAIFQTIYSAVPNAPGEEMFFTDTDAQPGNNYYRMEYMPTGGEAGYSEVVAVHFEGNHKNEPYLFPNPTNGKAYLQIPPVENVVRWQLADAQGRILQQGSVQPQSTWQTQPFLLADVPRGVYFIRFSQKGFGAIKVVRE